jgi:hypothetical protein
VSGFDAAFVLARPGLEALSDLEAPVVRLA